LKEELQRRLHTPMGNKELIYGQSLLDTSAITGCL
jgi:hypothetical protein